MKKIIKYETPEIEVTRFEVEKNLMDYFPGPGDEVTKDWWESQTTIPGGWIPDDDE